MGSEEWVLHEERRFAGVLSVPSNGVFWKSSETSVGHDLHLQLFSRYYLLF